MKKIFNGLALGCGPARRPGLQPGERELGNLIWRPSGTVPLGPELDYVVDAGC